MTQAPELESLDQLRAAHVAALNAGDADAWVACFTHDAVQLPPNFPANVGTEEICRWSGGLLAAFDCEFSLSPEEIRTTGPDWAFERGTYAIALAPRAHGEEFKDVGKYVTLYQREADGRWLMARDIWNSNDPLPAVESR